MKTVEGIRIMFKKETGIDPDNSQGEPDIEYVWWLEKQFIEQSQQIDDDEFGPIDMTNVEPDKLNLKQQTELPSDEEIINYFTKEHYHYQKGRFTRVDKDRIFGAKWAVEWIKKQMK